jgi:hypothetical protein
MNDRSVTPTTSKSGIARTLYGGYRGFDNSGNLLSSTLGPKFHGIPSGDRDPALRQRIWVGVGSSSVSRSHIYPRDLCLLFPRADYHILATCTTRRSSQLGNLDTASFCRTFESLEDDLWGSGFQFINLVYLLIRVTTSSPNNPHPHPPLSVSDLSYRILIRVPRLALAIVQFGASAVNVYRYLEFFISVRRFQVGRSHSHTLSFSYDMDNRFIRASSSLI